MDWELLRYFILGFSLGAFLVCVLVMKFINDLNSNVQSEKRKRKQNVAPIVFKTNDNRKNKTYNGTGYYI